MVSRLEDQKVMLASLISATGNEAEDIEVRYKVALRTELAGLQSERAKLVAKLKQEKIALDAVGAQDGHEDEEEEEDGGEQQHTREKRLQAERLKNERLIAVLEWKLSLIVGIRAQLGDYQYVTTLHMIERGIGKLRAVQDVRALEKQDRRAWVGLRGPRLPACLRCTDSDGLSGALSTCFISATFDKELALTHSRGSEWGCPVLVELEVGCMDSGVSLEALSQFQEERDLVFPPFTCFEVIDVPRFDSVSRAQGNRTEVLVLPVRISLPPTPAPPPSITQCFAFAPIHPPSSPIILAAIAHDTLLQLDRKLRHAVAKLVRNPKVGEVSVERQAASLSDAIKFAARQVLAEVADEQEALGVLSRGMKAFEDGVSAGFFSDAESVASLLAKNLLTVDAAAAERKRLKEFASWNAELPRICALMDAAEDDDTEHMTRLLQDGVDVNSQTLSGTSALHKASSNGHEASTRLLLQNNADVNLSDNGGFAPLHKACSNGCLGVATILLESGASLESQVCLALLRSACVVPTDDLLGSGAVR